MQLLASLVAGDDDRHAEAVGVAGERHRAGEEDGGFGGFERRSVRAVEDELHGVVHVLGERRRGGGGSREVLDRDDVVRLAGFERDEDRAAAGP